MESKKLEVPKTKNWKIMALSTYVVCGNQKSNFIKEQEVSALLTQLRMRTTLIKIPLLTL